MSALRAVFEQGPDGGWWVTMPDGRIIRVGEFCSRVGADVDRLVRELETAVEAPLQEAPIRSVIFRREDGNTEEWLEIGPGETLYYHRENAGYVAQRKGVGAGAGMPFTAEEAKLRWPRHAEAIDRQLAKLRGEV